MAYKEHGMWEVLDVLKRIHRGESTRQVSRATGRSRNTVRRYVKTAKELGWLADDREPEEELAARVLAKHIPGPEKVEGESARLLAPHKEKIEAWLKPEEGRGLQLSKVHRLLTRSGVHVSYISLYRYAQRHFDFGGSRSTVRMAEVAAGELAEVDFGRLGLIPDPEAGGRRVLHALVVTLVHSRHQYVHVTHSQKLSDLIEGLEQSWSFFGGVTRRVVVDNLKAAVIKADRYVPEFQRTFNEYAEHRGFVIDAAVAASPTHKPKVERQVPYVRENFFRGESFLNCAHAQREAAAWCLKVAGQRVHGTTRKQPLAEFERSERTALRPLEKGRFDTPRWAEVKVHPDQHIRFGNALYSVPYQHQGRCTKGETVTIRGDRGLVRIYLRGELVKTHPTQRPGQRATDYGDYPSEKTEYALRDSERLVTQARNIGPQIEEFMRELLRGEFPWSKFRQGQKLIRMTDKYGVGRVEEACRRALSFDLINVKRVERIIVQALENQNDSKTSHSSGTPAEVISISSRFLRDGKHFNHQNK